MCTNGDNSIHSPLDNLALPNGEAQRLTTLVARIELGAVRSESTTVVHLDGVTRGGLAGAVLGLVEDLDGHFVGGGGGHVEGCGDEREDDGEGEAHLVGLMERGKLSEIYVEVGDEKGWGWIGVMVG